MDESCRDENELAQSLARTAQRSTLAESKHKARIEEEGKSKAKPLVWSDNKEASVIYKAVAAGLAAALSDALGPGNIDKACAEAAAYLGAVNLDNRGGREGKVVRCWWKNAERSSNAALNSAFAAARRGDSFSAALTASMLASGGADAVRKALRVLATGRWAHVKQQGGSDLSYPFEPDPVEVLPSSRTKDRDRT